MNKNSKRIFPVIIVGIPVIIRIFIYIFVIIKGFGTFSIGNYLGIILNLVMYVSILKYAIDYFIKCNENASLKSLVFRFGIATLATLFGLQNENETIFKLTAIMVFIVPYISSMINPNNKDRSKKEVILIISLVLIVLVISIILSILYIKNPIPNEISNMGTNIYNLGAMNSTVQWILFTILGFVRGLSYKNNEKKI